MSGKVNYKGCSKLHKTVDKLPLVSIIILNWNGKKDTIECLDSLKQITYPNYVIILVDNGSTDGSVECFKKRYPEIEIIENKENLGFAEGNNIAIRAAITRNAKYIFMLNNDTVVEPNILNYLEKVLEMDPIIGIAGPTVYHYKEKSLIQSAGGTIIWSKGRAPSLTYKQDVSRNKLKDVVYVAGCSLLAKAELFQKIGYLNNNYFAYWEETDWCVRAKKAGYRIVHVPVAKIWHKGGSTTKKTSGFYEYHMTRNMFWFMKTHSSKTQYLSFLIYFFGFRLWILTWNLAYYKNIKVYRYLIKGIFDGVRTSH